MRAALSLLTIAPVRIAHGPVAAWFPAVGALLGLAAAGIALAARELTDSPPLAAALSLATLVVLTGALHHDGLADCADAIGVRGDRERRLAVMRESAIGTYGGLALLLHALVFVTAVSALPDDEVLTTLLVVGASSRWAALLHAGIAAPARRDGLGAWFHVSMPAHGAATLTVVALAATAGWRGAVGPAAAVLVACATAAWANRVLGGRTGDTLGATIILAESAALVGFLAA